MMHFHGNTFSKCARSFPAKQFCCEKCGEIQLDMAGVPSGTTLEYAGNVIRALMEDEAARKILEMKLKTDGWIDTDSTKTTPLDLMTETLSIIKADPTKYDEFAIMLEDVGLRHTLPSLDRIERETTMSKDQQPSSQQKKQQNEAGPGLRRMKEPIKPDLSRRRERIKSAPGKTRTSSAKQKQRLESDSGYAGKGGFSRTSSGELPPLTAEASAFLQPRSKNVDTSQYDATSEPPQPAKYLPPLPGSKRALKMMVVPIQEDDTAKSSRSPVLLAKLREKVKEVNSLNKQLQKEIKEKEMLKKEQNEVMEKLKKFQENAKTKKEQKEKEINDYRRRIAELEKEKRDNELEHKKKVKTLEESLASVEKVMEAEKKENENEKLRLECKLHDAERKLTEKDNVILKQEIKILQLEKRFEVEARDARIQELEAQLQEQQI